MGKSENMTELQIETIKKIVYAFGSKANIIDTNTLMNYYQWILMSVSLNDLVNRKIIIIQDIEQIIQQKYGQIST